MLTWNESLHLAKEKLLNNQCLNFISLPLSDQTEPGSGGDQPVRDNLTDRNRDGNQPVPILYNPILGEYALENALPR